MTSRAQVPPVHLERSGVGIPAGTGLEPPPYAIPRRMRALWCHTFECRSIQYRAGSAVASCGRSRGGLCSTFRYYNTGRALHRVYIPGTQLRGFWLRQIDSCVWVPWGAGREGHMMDWQSPPAPDAGCVYVCGNGCRPEGAWTDAPPRWRHP